MVLDCFMLFWVVFSLAIRLLLRCGWLNYVRAFELRKVIALVICYYAWLICYVASCHLVCFAFHNIHVVVACGACVLGAWRSLVGCCLVFHIGRSCRSGAMIDIYLTLGLLYPFDVEVA